MSLSTAHNNSTIRLLGRETEILHLVQAGTENKGTAHHQGGAHIYR